MEPDPEAEPTQSLSARWTAVGDAITNENRQWVHQVNVVDAQNNRVGVVGYTPAETFQHGYARRLIARENPNRRRRQSSPLPARRDVPTARNMRIDQPRLDWLRRVKNSGVQKLRQAKDTTVDKLSLIGNRMVRLIYNVRRRDCRKTFIRMGIGLVLLIALAHTNSRAAHYKASQATPASLYISSFRKFPTWLHTDPVQVIGLPAQVDPAFIPSRRTIQKACNRYTSTWHPDKFQINLVSERDNFAILDRGFEACDVFEMYHNNQYCMHDRRAMRDFDSWLKYRDDPVLLPVLDGFSSVPPGAPHFAKNCACTWAKYRRMWLYQLLMPVDLQPDPPTTLEETCPCTRDIAMKSWLSFSFDAKSPQPPYLGRIKNDLSVLTTDWRVLWWRIKGLVFYDDREIFEREFAMACAQGTHKGCERMEGWASFIDFNYDKSCEASVRYQEGKDIKIEAEGEDIIDEGEMLRKLKEAIKDKRWDYVRDYRGEELDEIEYE